MTGMDIGAKEILDAIKAVDHRLEQVDARLTRGSESIQRDLGTKATVTDFARLEAKMDLLGERTSRLEVAFEGDRTERQNDNRHSIRLAEWKQWAIYLFVVIVMGLPGIAAFLRHP